MSIQRTVKINGRSRTLSYGAGVWDFKERKGIIQKYKYKHNNKQ